MVETQAYLCRDVAKDLVVNGLGTTPFRGSATLAAADREPGDGE